MEKFKPMNEYSKGELYRMIKITMKDAIFFQKAAWFFGVLWLIANTAFVWSIIK